MSDTNPDQPQEEPAPKIHIDEDWKEQVQAEKEELHDEGAGQPKPDEEHAIPEASFAMLVTTLATQATVALGQMAAPDATEVPVDFALAKHMIDTLAVLEEKTKGNLTDEESAMLTSVLHQLRMLFVGVQSQATPAEPEKGSSIELP